ncbi:MAG TPA: glycosyltransferase family 1 protein [Gemmatimonadaceae bacterium]|nr:glycosyltransferase family 1 protein [Gemmatimonadaceae bacterium]
MKIGVSGWRLSGQPLGVSRYIEYVVKRWHGMLAPSEQVTVFVCEPLSANQRAGLEGFNVEEVRPRLTNALWENLLLPRHAKDLDVLFCPSYTVPLTYKGRTVVAIHSADEVAKRFPDWRVWPAEQKYKFGARKADRIIVNAHAVKTGIMELYGVPAEKIDVVWLAADEAFRPITDDSRLSATRRKFLGADRPFVLLVGGLSKRRNIPLLMSAFSVLKKTAKIPHALLLVGPNRANIPLQQLAAELGIADSVVQTDGRFSDHQELVAVYNAADVFVLPSESEGFSLTLSEAMSCGTAVITVNRAGLGEMAHGYGVTLERPEVEALTEALRHVLLDSDFRRSIGIRCLERSRAFSWEKTASKTLDILRQVASA